MITESPADFLSARFACNLTVESVPRWFKHWFIKKQIRQVTIQNKPDQQHAYSL